MKKLISLFATAVLMLSMSATSSAAIITDTVVQSEYINANAWWDNSWSYTHNINDSGFVLGSAESATISIDLWDDYNDGWGQKETVKLFLDNFGYSSVTAWSISDVFANLGFGALAELNADGYLNVTIKALQGDFYVGDSVLTVSTVPEPASVLLIGLGLLGFGASRMRKSQ